MKTLTLRLLTAVMVWLSAPMIGLAQAPIVLSNPGAPLVFELPPSTSTAQSLTDTASVQLATRAQHNTQGLAYPDWLSDAAFTLNKRSRERLAVVVTPKRGNPALTTELLLAINTGGRRSTVAIHLMFDTLHRFAGEAPSVAALQALADKSAANPADSKPNLNYLLTPVIRFDPEAPAKPARAAVAISAPVPDQSSQMADFSVLSTHRAQQAPRPSTVKLIAKSRDNVTKPLPAQPPPITPQMTPPIAPPITLPTQPSLAPPAAASQLATNSSAPQPMVAAPVPAPAPSSATPTAPTTSATADASGASMPMALKPNLAPQPPIQTQPVSELEHWLTDWPLILGGLLLVLAMLYLLVRAVNRWRKRDANQTQTTFIEPANTATPPEEAGTNTVFGVSPEEANAMHAKWLREQAGLRKN